MWDSMTSAVWMDEGDDVKQRVVGDDVKQRVDGDDVMQRTASSSISAV